MAGGLKRILPRTLFGRSLLILILPILLLQILSTFIFFDRHWTKMTSRLAFAVAGEITLAAESIEMDPSSRSIAEISRRMDSTLDIALTYTSGGTWRALKEEQKKGEIFIAALLRFFLTERLNRPFIINVDEDRNLVLVRIKLSDGILDALIPQRRLFSSTGYIYLMWSAALSLVLLAIAIAFMRNQIRPIRKLAVAAELFGKGRDVPATFKPEGAIEVRQAAWAFLEMRDRIKRQIDQRTSMLAGISHDLRTPLTRMKLQLAVMPESADVCAMKEDVQVMERMVAGYLAFIRGGGDEVPQKTDLIFLTKEVLQTSLRDGGPEVELKAPDSLFISLRPIAFARCLANLIGNARRYANNISLSIQEEQNKGVEIFLDDNGPGIPEDRYEDVFKPFYRVDESRNTESGGVGLGLPIVQDIVHAHGGRIWLGKSPLGGLRVGIFLPT